MDTNSSSTEKLDSSQVVWSSDEQGLSHVKSFACTFCKKGFSNAQALGGHMNIHRKDRAKLRESFDETLLSDNLKASEDKPSEDKSYNPNRRGIFSTEEHDGASRGIYGIKEQQKLPQLLVENPLTSDDVRADKATKSSVGSTKTELDLELRLGFEPHQT